MITKFKIFEFKTMEQLKELEEKQKLLYDQLQTVSNKKDQEKIEDEILINSRVIERLRKNKIE